MVHSLMVFGKMVCRQELVFVSTQMEAAMMGIGKKVNPTESARKYCLMVQLLMGSGLKEKLEDTESKC